MGGSRAWCPARPIGGLMDYPLTPDPPAAPPAPRRIGALRAWLLICAAPTPELARKGHWLNVLLLSFVLIGLLATPVGLVIPHSGLLPIDGTAVILFAGLY